MYLDNTQVLLQEVHQVLYLEVHQEDLQEVPLEVHQEARQEVRLEVHQEVRLEVHLASIVQQEAHLVRSPGEASLLLLVQAPQAVEQNLCR